MYGMGMGSYGGGYGSSYGSSSYGGMGSYGSSYGSSNPGTTYPSRYGAEAAKTAEKSPQNPEGIDPNNPNAVGERQKQEEQSHRKVLFEEWFKMMGGLRSILELGFAAIALANFCSRSADIFKKFMEFGKQASKSMGSFIESKLPTRIFTNLSSPEKRGKAIRTIVMMVVRVFAALLLLLGFRLRKDIRVEAARKEAAMKAQLEHMKLQEVQLQEQAGPEHEDRLQRMQREGLQEATL